MMQLMSTNNLWLDKKYIGLISGSLEKFKWLNPKTATFRCPLCGDSQKNKNKTRGYFYEKGMGFNLSCHNCGASMRLPTLLKNNYPTLYQEYRMESFQESLSGSKSILSDSVDSTEVQLDIIQLNERSISLAELPDTHEAVLYCKKRCIPESKFDRIRYTEKFCDYIVKDLGLEKYKLGNTNRLPNDKRIILELRDENKKLIGVQGRSIMPDPRARYITIKLKDNYPKIYGLDTLDVSKPIFAVEGPIDSLFLPNCIAFCGGDVNIPLKSINKESVYILLDNEPRSKDTVARMSKAIEQGYNVMFWRYSTHLKDINDMIQKGGFTAREILQSVKEYSKSGIAAKAELINWKKV